MATEDDRVAAREFLAEMEPRPGPFGRSLVEPAEGETVQGKDRAVGDDEGVTRTFRFLQELVHLLVVGIVEIGHDPGIVPHREAEGGLPDGHPQLRGHAGRHIFVIGLLGIRAPDVMVADHRHERKALQVRLKVIHGVGQHPAVHVPVAAVPLDEITDLQGETGGIVDQAGRPGQQARAAVRPHLPVAGELSALDLAEVFIRLIVTGVVDRVGGLVEMGVPQNDHRIASAFPGRILPLQQDGRPRQAQRGDTARRQR